ncbi:hypothetical protein BDZ89DRAFT_1130820 [Hymenopellis radicata]|nr:hypothetical protein BDZ89DRAFT_1130820 [Hymenopellis radicata]
MAFPLSTSAVATNRSQLSDADDAAQDVCEPTFIYDVGDEHMRINTRGKKLFVVTAGLRLGIFTGWKTCKPNVRTGDRDQDIILGARWQGFGTYQECLDRWRDDHINGRMAPHNCPLPGLAICSGSPSTHWAAVGAPLSPAPAASSPLSPSRPAATPRRKTASRKPPGTPSMGSSSSSSVSTSQPSTSASTDSPRRNQYVVTVISDDDDKSSEAPSRFEWFVVWTSADDDAMVFSTQWEAQAYITKMRTADCRVVMRAGRDLPAMLEAVISFADVL